MQGSVSHTIFWLGSRGIVKGRGLLEGIAGEVDPAEHGFQSTLQQDLQPLNLELNSARQLQC